MTTEPRILDAKGRPLAVGSRVKTPSCKPGEAAGKVVGIRWMRGWSVEAQWPGEDRPVRWPTEPDFEADTFRAPDLELIDQYDKEESREAD